MAATITVSLWDALHPILRASLAEYRESLEAEGVISRSVDERATARFWQTAQVMTERLSAPAVWDEPSLPEYGPAGDVPTVQDWHNEPRSDAPVLSPETAEMWRELADLANGEWSYAPC